jgi:branched-chain amino acid transport system permease protein
LIPALLITLGLAFILEEGTLTIWDRSMAGLVSQFATIRWGQIYLPGNRLAVLILMLAISAALQIWLTRTDSGRCLRALSQESTGATLVGISLTRVTGIAFAMATALAAMAGLFYVTLFTVSPHLGLPLTLKALFIVVISGSGSLTRPLAGGLALGTLETMLAAIFGAHWANVLSIGLLLAFLCWRPQGLFARRLNAISN